MKDSRHIIWTDYLDYDDWKEDLEAQYPELSANERMNLMLKSTALIFRTRKRIWIFSFPVRFSLSGTWDFGTAAVWGTKKLKAAISAIAFIRNGTLTTPLGLWIKTAISAARRFITTAQTTTSTAPTRTAFPKRKSTI